MRNMAAIVSALTVLVLAVLAFGQGRNQPAAPRFNSATTTLTSGDSAKVNWDSLYSEIQKGFVQVLPILDKGCFDCHSTKTDYPWYYKLPVVKGMINRDIQQARKHCDMTRGFPFVGRGTPADDLDAIRDMIQRGEMPPWEYRLMHWNAKPTAAQSDSIVSWVNHGLAMLAAHGQYPTPATPKEDDDESGEKP